MRGIVAIILCLVFMVHACAAVQITEFCPDPYLFSDADEFLVISGNGPLANITVSDREGGFRFPPGATIKGSLTIARNATAYRQVHGRFPDYELLDSTPYVPDVINSHLLRMANSNDELELYQDGVVLQNVSWPGDVKPREGQVHYLEEGMWDHRVMMIGQTRLAPAIFRNVSVRTFVSPDCSNEVYSEAINNAKKTVVVNMYEFSSPMMGESLTAAKMRGVDVQVLIEGGPVGGISAAERSLIWNLNRSGIPVLSMVSTQTDHAPYRYNHAKYVVIDNASLFLTSENFKNSGFPPKGTSGNRGWGVLLEDPALAGYFSRLYALDSGSRSVVPFTGTAGDFEQVSFGKHEPEYFPEQFNGATVTPVIAPDTSHQILDLLDGAGTSIEIEQAYIKNETLYSLNPYLEAAVNASRRGVHVRVLLDSYWYNVDDTRDNDEMAALINHIAATEHLPLEAKCADLSVSQVEKIHNKGVIVDDKRVLISSINWNSNSPNFNREAGVIIDHAGAARYFREVFDDDWNPVAHIGIKKTDYVRVVIVILVIVILLAVYFHRRRI